MYISVIVKQMIVQSIGLKQICMNYIIVICQIDESNK